MEEKRDCEIYQWSCNEWINIEYKNLRTGDIFRLIEPNGTYVVDENGCLIFQAISMVYINHEGKEAVDVSSRPDLIGKLP